MAMALLLTDYTRPYDRAGSLKARNVHTFAACHHGIYVHMRYQHDVPAYKRLGKAGDVLTLSGRSHDRAAAAESALKIIAAHLCAARQR